MEDSSGNMERNSSLTAASLKIIATMVIFGLIGLVRRSIPYSSSMLAFFRGAIATVILILLRLFNRKGVDKAAIRRNLLPLVISGIMIGFNWILLFEAYRFTTIAVATISYYMHNAHQMLTTLRSLGHQTYGGENAPYIWMKTPGGLSSWQYFNLLLEEANVVCTPGIGFGPSGEGYVRFTAFNTRENTEKAMERIRAV